MSALSQPLTQRCSRCGIVSRQQHREAGDGVVCLACYADTHACDVCGGNEKKRRVVGPRRAGAAPRPGALGHHLRVLLEGAAPGARARSDRLALAGAGEAAWSEAAVSGIGQMLGVR